MRRCFMLTFALWTVLAPIGPAAAQGPSRADFARRLARVREGMTRDQVRAITGAPNDTLTRIDPELEPTTIVGELWGWGSDRHGAFPALGSVSFDRRGRVFFVRGGTGTPLSGVPERELRGYFARLAEVPGLEGGAFDPRPLVRAVNALHPLGARRALDVIAEYLRVAPSYTRFHTDGVYLVLRTLFEPPHPAMLVGAPEPAPTHASDFPSFPLALVDDVPLLLVSGYTLAGEAQPPEQHLPFYRARGVLRRAPLAPSARPFASLARFARERRALPFRGPGRLSMLMEQILRLVDDVYRPAETGPGAHFDPRIDPNARFGQMSAEFDRLGARWDGARQAYVARGAAPRPPLARATRTRWTRTHRGVVIEVLLERTSATSVRYWLHLERRGPGPAPTDGTIRLVATGASRDVLEQSPMAGMLGSYSVSDVALASGRSVVVHIDAAGSRIDSPALAP